MIDHALHARSPLLATNLARPVVIAPLILLIALILFALGSVMVRRINEDSFLAGNREGGPESVRDRVVPEFTLPMFDGTTVRAADLRGRGVVVNFWSSWCVPCQREMPILARLAREYDPKSVAFVGVALWDAQSDARAFLNRYGGDFPAGVDEQGKIAIDFGVGGLPETFFIRADGTFRRKWIGEISEAQLRSFVDEIRS